MTSLRMPHGTRAFFYPHSLGADLNDQSAKASHHSLGTDLNDQSLGDSPYVPAVWDGPLMSGAPRGVK